MEFVGLRSFTSESLLKAVAGRMDYIRKRDATDSRADDAAYLVESYLRTHGLPDAVISGQRISDNKIRLTIKEGLSQFLGSIKVTGFDDVEAIQEQFQATFPETVKRRAFEAKFIEEGLERVRDLLRTNGYWKSIVTAVQESRQANGKIPFTLKVEKGPLFTLEIPKLESQVQPSAALKKIASEARGATATAENIISLRRSIPGFVEYTNFHDMMGVIVVSVDKTKAGQGMDAGMGVARRNPIAKVVIVVDSDINILDKSQVLFAVGSRWQPFPASAVIEDTWGLKTDPSQPKPGRTSKMVIDAARQFAEEGGRETFPETNRELLEQGAPDSMPGVEQQFGNLLKNWEPV